MMPVAARCLFQAAQAMRGVAHKPASSNTNPDNIPTSTPGPQIKQRSAEGQQLRRSALAGAVIAFVTAGATQGIRSGPHAGPPAVAFTCTQHVTGRVKP